MDNSLTVAKKLLLEPAALDDGILQKILNSIYTQQIDYADLYFQQRIHEGWYLEDSQVKTGSYSIDKGVGVRAVSGEKTGFAYTDDVLLPAIESAASAAKSIAKTGKQQVQKIESSSIVTPLYKALNPIDTTSNADKIKLLEELDRYARGLDPRIIQVNASLSGLYEVVLVLNANGEINADVRPLVSANVSVIVEDKDKRESARSGGGGRVDYNYFFEQDKAFEYVRDAVDEAVTNLDADESPAGSMPVVLGPGWPGVLLHEAVGHGLEGDFNRKKTSVFSDRIGEQVAAKGVTVVDDGTIANRRGSLSIDDEGTPSQNTVLIEDGVLVNYMQDKLNARLMGMDSTGNCRRESYAHIPMPRMTNTYMLAGEYSPEEIISTVDKGIYATNFGGGSVDITSGKFVFSASRAYLIENGKVTKPIKGATLIGNGPEVMQKVSMIGNDLQLDKGIGVCGKEGQSVPVGVGQPTLKIDALTVGGTKV